MNKNAIEQLIGRLELQQAQTTDKSLAEAYQCCIEVLETKLQFVEIETTKVNEYSFWQFKNYGKY